MLLLLRCTALTSQALPTESRERASARKSKRKAKKKEGQNETRRFAPLILCVVFNRSLLGR